MRKLILTSILGLSLLGAQLTNAADEPVSEKEVVVGISDAFIPGGFDSESDVYVVVNGLFPNGCYRWNRVDVNHENGEKIHEVRSIATVSQGMCIMVLVPFTKEVTLGKLGAGHHKIRFVNGDGTFMEKAIDIE